MKKFQIAIDGPVAAGKGTVSRLIAQKLNFLYVDTGAMYRVVGLLGIENNIDFSRVEELVELVKKSKIEMHNPTKNEADGRLTTVLVNGVDVSWKIRTEDAGKGASKVAQIPEIRQVLVAKQQQITQTQSVVMEGRDITYRVLPDANLKIFLTGKDFIRSNRRYAQLQARGVDITFDQVFADLVKRDKLDMERAVDPLQIVDDAWVIDTSELSIQQVVDLIVVKARIMMNDL